ncbi:hypothetical protein [Nocardioides caldifontis]|uniref:hypothetical protein n=1 Tax=Nocardioides caldifontis TaxID=2588938 RepID=UPI0011E03711|nr:hypothetical protein [Nocardioides caldifontis]
MADDDEPGTEGPTLELPSLFRRRRKTAEPEAAGPEAPTDWAEPAGRADSAAEERQDAPARRSRFAEVRKSPLEDRPAPGPEATPVGSTEPPARASRPRPAEPSAPLGERVTTAVPPMAASTAAVVVGALVGLLGCVATWIGLQGCEAVTGAQTCGGPGLLVLVAIVVGQIALGAALLQLLGVPEPGNLSLLGVGLMVVVALLVLVDHLYDGWMFVAIPVVTAVTFGAARWITTRYADDSDDYPSEQHDIR